MKEHKRGTFGIHGVAIRLL